jgi:branched-chain amino acid transport system substrate-binding protein
MTKGLLSGVALAAFMAVSMPAHADIKIGVAGPMTGSEAAFGAQMKLGAEAAVADINAAGGVNGEKLSLEIGDDACDPKQATAVANQMAQDGAVFVAGHFCSGSSIPASSVYAEEGVVMISPGSTNPKFTDERPGPGIYRVCGRDDMQGVVAGKYLAAHFKGKNIAILQDKTAYGKGIADQTKKALNDAGVKEVMYEAYTAGERDYSALVSKMKAANVDAVYLGGYYAEGGLILRQMRQQGMQAQMFGGDALMTQEFGNIAGKLSDGVMMTFSPDARKFPEAAEVVKRFEAKGQNPEGYTLYTYAAVQAWAQAASQAKSTEFENVVKALDSGKFNTVIGPISFDKKGDPVGATYNFYVWKDGTYSEAKVD